jgi:hypothetical protein
LRQLGDDYAVRGYGDQQGKKKGADETNAEFLVSRTRCIDEASCIWFEEELAGGDVTRIGALCQTLYDALPKDGYWKPADPDHIREWIKDAAKRGSLSIPPKAQVAGRPKKKAK